LKRKVIKYFKGDIVIWIVILIISIFSLLAVYSASGTLAYKYQGGDTSYYFFKHTFFLIFGLCITYIIHLMPYRYFWGISPFILYLSFPLLILTLFLGENINQASRWLTLPIIGLSFQTSDLAKFALIIYVARFLSKRKDNRKINKNEFFSIIIPIFFITFLILPANFSTAIILFINVLILLFIGRVRTSYILSSLFVLLIAFIFFVFIAMQFPKIFRVETWEKRIENYLSEDSKTNYQVEQSKIAIATGGFFGKFPGNSTQRNFLPHPYSDFIYAIILEEYGLFGGIIILFLYLFLFFRTGIIVKESTRTFPSFLSMGLTISLVFQALSNMAVAVNLIPVTGQPLPFISMGGTSLLFTSVAFGIILRLSRIKK